MKPLKLINKLNQQPKIKTKINHIDTNKYFAYDTETKNGKAFYLTFASENKEFGIDIKNKTDILNFFDYLFENKYKIGFCFNLDYDIISLMTYYKEHLINLYTANELIVGNFKITYLKNKNFKIKKGMHKNSPVVNIYDIQQFYNTTLDNAAEKFLKQKKVDIGENRSNDIYEFYIQNPIKFKTYALTDAILTYKLSMKLVNELPTITKYYSAGYIVYNLEKSLNNGFKTDVEVDVFMRKNFYGARIEFLKRGTFKDVFIYDIKSAYPSIIAELYNIIYTKFSNNIDKQARYSFIECNITIPDIYNIGFTPIRKDVIQFVSGTFDTMIDNISLEYYNKQGATINKIYKVLNVYTTDNQPYKTTVNKLFEKRKTGDFQNYLYKLLLNSCFGKKAERKQQYKAIDRNTFELLKLEIIENEINGITSIFDLTKIKDNYFKIDRSGRGNHYNIIEATLILSLTRLKLLKTAISVGSNNVIGFMTDSIFTSKKIEDNLITNKLGGFELQEKVNNLTVVGSGVYQTDNKTKFRGFNSKLNLRELFKNQPDLKIIDVEVNKKMGLGSFLRTSKANESKIFLNSIDIDNRELDINFDKKRIWESELDSTSILNKNQNSKVIKI